MARERTGGAVLIDALKINGAKLAFCVPGESYLEALDAFHDASDAIRVITCRQEGGATYMAEAYGKSTGRPGIAFVTRGPGATHATVAIHTAKQDSTPLILFVGQIDRSMRDREAFQEVDTKAFFSPIAKWAAQIEDAKRIPEYVARAFHVATSGRPGPVVLGLPEDMLIDVVSVDDVATAPPANANPSRDAIARMRGMLAEAQRPIAILGGSGWTETARRQVATFLEASRIPATCGFRRQHLFDNRSPYYAGDVGIGMNPLLVKRFAECDLIVAIGTRMSEAVTNGYTLITSPRPAQKVVQIHPDPDELGRVYQVDLPIVSAMPEFAAALAESGPVPGGRWEGWTQSLHDDYEISRTTAVDAAAAEGFVDLVPVVRHLDATLPDDAILTTGAGNYAGWLNRYFRFRNFATQLGPINGSMGYGVPAAVAAKLTNPDKIVIAWVGDGEFGMTGQELATAVQHDARIITIIIDNGMYGTIRMHQERDHPERISGTSLRNPDFAMLAQAYGAHGEALTRAQDFPAAFERALASGKPAVIALKTDPEIISTRATITSLRKTGVAR